MGNQPSDSRRRYGDYFVSGDRIGSGTFATVKRCTRKADKKEFAVKIIDKRHLTGRELVGLKDEIRILKSMEFPHVIKMADVFDDGRRVKMVLELCEGGDLFDQILKSPKRRFNEARSARVTTIVARSLKYLHTHFVVHRDLKPENILFTKNGVLKVTDFGLAHYLKLPPELHVMHTCCGTPHYVAPEVLSSNEYGPAVDLWSLGVILYIMLSGYQPFNSHSIHAMYGMIIRGQYKFPSPHWDHVSEEAKDCVRGLMCVDLKRRLTPDQLVKHPWIIKHVDLKALQEEEVKLLQQQRAMLTPTGKDSNNGNKKEFSFDSNKQSSHSMNSITGIRNDSFFNINDAKQNDNSNDNTGNNSNNNGNNSNNNNNNNNNNNSNNNTNSNNGNSDNTQNNSNYNNNNNNNNNSNDNSNNNDNDMTMNSSNNSSAKPKTNDGTSNK